MPTTMNRQQVTRRSRRFGVIVGIPFGVVIYFMGMLTTGPDAHYKGFHPLDLVVNCLAGGLFVYLLLQVRALDSNLRPKIKFGLGATAAVFALATALVVPQSGIVLGMALAGILTGGAIAMGLLIAAYVIARRLMERPLPRVRNRVWPMWFTAWLKRLFGALSRYLLAEKATADSPQAGNGDLESPSTPGPI